MRSKIKPYLILTVLTLTGVFTVASLAAEQTAPVVVTDIKPIHGLTSALMQGVGDPLYLVPDGTSPHDHTLRPSDASALGSADLILWMGSQISPFLTKPITQRPNLDLSHLGGIEPLPLRRAGMVRGQAYSGFDPHIWFNPLNARLMAQVIERRLSEVDPQHQPIYEKNLAALEADLKQLDAEISQTLSSRTAATFVLTHDSIQYFTARYGLPVAAILTNGPDHPRSLNTSRSVRQFLLSGPRTCVVGEPPYPTNSNTTLLDGTKAGSVFIDPFGTSIPAGPGHYGLTIRKLAKDLARCSPR